MDVLNSDFKALFIIQNVGWNKPKARLPMHEKTSVIFLIVQNRHKQELDRKNDGYRSSLTYRNGFLLFTLILPNVVSNSPNRIELLVLKSIAMRKTVYITHTLLYWVCLSPQSMNKYSYPIKKYTFKSTWFIFKHVKTLFKLFELTLKRLSILIIILNC